MEDMEEIEEMLSVSIRQLVAYIYSITLEEMDQEQLQNAAERGTKLIENIREVIESMVQLDALAYRLLTNDGIEREFRINIEINGDNSLTWSIPA